MTREDRFLEFYSKNLDVSFMGSNVPLIYENVDKAYKDGKLYDFFMNRKPYRSSFAFFDGNQARGKDQVAIVMALNIYGIDHPGFAFEVNKVLKRLALGSKKELMAPMVLINTQSQLQKTDVSLINFLDKALADAVIKNTKKQKVWRIILYVLLFVAADIGTIGLSMAGLYFIPLLTVPVFVYSLIQFFKWLGIAACINRKSAEGATDVSDYVE